MHQLHKISDLIVGKTYEVIVKLTGATITATIGTSSGGSQTKSQTITISNANESSYIDLLLMPQQ